ncbi:MAG: hypothetical protein IJJ85_10220 [Clostridia bacterium]|nr:hypothetical protein [Clostridia bacterium]
MKKKLFFVISLLLVLWIPFSACTDDRNTDPAAPSLSDGKTDPVADADGFLLSDGIYITELFSYSGPYVEDGSNDECEGICAVRLENRSDVHYQYLHFTLETAGGNCTFSASTLFAGDVMTVLCEEKTPFANGQILGAEVISAAPFYETPSVHLEALKITYAEGFLNVENLTDETLKNVYIYYKNLDANGYLGGITYRTLFKEIPAGEIRQAQARSIHPNTSRVVFSTYES